MKPSAINVVLGGINHHPAMDEEEDDDIYASAGTINGAAIRPNITGDTIRPNTAAADLEDGEEEGEEVEEVEEDDSDSVIQSVRPVISHC